MPANLKFFANKKRFPTIIGAALILFCQPGVTASQYNMVAESKIQVARYSLIHSVPTPGQLDLLATVNSITIPNEIQNVGEAIRWVLKDSGYRLASDEHISDSAKALLKYPLPAKHRKFKPLALSTILSILIGPAFVLVQDPVHRLIGIELCGDLDNEKLDWESMLQAGPASTDKSQPVSN